LFKDRAPLFIDTRARIFTINGSDNTSISKGSASEKASLANRSKDNLPLLFSLFDFGYSYRTVQRPSSYGSRSVACKALGS